MSYKTGNFKMFKGSLKHFKKHNPVAWRNRWLFNLKAGDYVYCCDGFNHKIKSINLIETISVRRCGAHNIKEMNIVFEDDFSCNTYHCLEPRKTNDQIKEGLIFGLEYFLEGTQENSKEWLWYKNELNDLLNGFASWNEDGTKK